MRGTSLAAAAVALAVTVALPAHADLYYKARTWHEGDQATKDANITVEAWVDGDRADIRFVESGNPFMKEGMRLVTKNEARELYLVNDEERTVSPWQLDQVLQMATSVMENMGGMMKLKIENAKVETLLEEPGGTVAGYSTTHYRYRTQYDMTFKIMGMGQTQRVESIQDIWSTTDLDARGLSVWLEREPPDFGDTGLKELIEAEQERIQGFPLRTVVEQTSVGKKGRESTSRTITEVEVIEERPAPAGAYDWPSDYQVVEMMPSLDELEADEDDDDEPEDEEEKKGWRGRLPFGKKKGGG